jgi:energy-coupling factor transport system permease protein
VSTLRHPPSSPEAAPTGRPPGTAADPSRGRRPGRVRARPGDRTGLHPLAWWLWAACLAAAAIQTQNPVLLGLLAAVVSFVVATRRTTARWGRSYAVFVKIAVFVIVFRLVLQMLFGQRLPGDVLFTIPSVSLPHWAQGVSIGGAETLQALFQTFCSGLQLAVILLCFGAANSLANPYRLLRCLPTVLYEAGVAVTVALAFTPELVMTLADVRDARRLRGRPNRGLSGIRGIALPVLEGALERSVELAASMDARGYGRREPVSRVTARRSGVLLVVGLLVLCAGLFLLLDGGGRALPGIGILVAGAVLLTATVVLGGARSRRTRYRPDPWGAPEWAACAAGVVVLVSYLLAAALHSGSLGVGFYPITFPPFPVLAAAGSLAGLVPVLVTAGSPP